MLRTALCPLGQEEGAAGRGPELLPPPPAHLCANGQAIDSTAQQCCSSARLAPKSMGLFSKLNLIQVRAPCPQAGPQLPSRASAHDAFVLRHPPPAPPSAAAWTPGAVGLRVSISLSTNRNERSLNAGLEAGVKGFLPCLEFM